MTQRQVLEALSGLLLGMFVAMIANTVVSTSMPIIVHDLQGNQSDYTWVITASLLATTISTPVWGKLADLTNRKLLLQIALVAFVTSSAIAGFSHTPSMLITLRVFQGLAGGGVVALAQIVMADILSPRERGRYMGLFGAVMAIGTVGGPLLGGWLTDVYNWRLNFFVAVPFAIIAIIVLQLTLHLPKTPRRKVSIDYLGIVLLSGGVALLLIWITMVGSGPSAQFEWASPETAWMTGLAGILLLAFVFVELKAKEPLLDLRLFRNLTFTLAVIGTLSVGVAMFGASVYLSQYMIMSRGANPTQAGLMTIPMMAGVLVISTVVGMLITRFGKWKSFMIVGAILLTGSLFLLGTIHYDTNYWIVATYMFMMGAGLGMVMQNLVLVVQNAVEPKNIGVASSAITFFRTLGGTAGVSWLGSMLSNKLPDLLQDRAGELKAAMAKLPPEQLKAFMAQQQSGSLPTPSSMPETIRPIFESAYGDGIAHLFTLAAPLAIVTVLCLIFMPNLPLSRQTRAERERQEVAAAPGAAPAAAGAAGGAALPDAAGEPDAGDVAGATAADAEGQTFDAPDEGPAPAEAPAPNPHDPLAVSTATAGIPTVANTADEVELTQEEVVEVVEDPAALEQAQADEVHGGLDGKTHGRHAR